jgi:WD40 repeat protein
MEAAWRELCAVLDAEVHSLSEKIRAPLVLCYLEGQTRDQAARQLGWSLRTLDRRLEQGRERLRARLARRGITLSAALLTTGLSQQLAIAALPPALLQQTIQAASGLAAGQAAPLAAISPKAIVLAEVALKGAVPMQLKVVAGVVLVAAVAVGGAGALAHQMLAAKPQAASGAKDSKPAVPGEKQAKDERAKPARTDYYGDPLPPGALVRMGSVQLRHPDADVVFSLDGKILISATSIVRSWDMATGKLVKHQRLHLEPAENRPGFSGATLAPDGNVLAGWENESVNLYDTHTGKRIQRLPAGLWSHSKLAFSHDGTLLATMGGLADRQEIRLWDMSTGKERFVLRHNHYINDLAFSPDDKHLISSDGNQLVHLWETSQGHELWKVAANGNYLAFSPDAKTVAAASREGIITLWSAGNSEHHETLRASPGVGRTSSLAFSHEGRWLALAGEDGLILWDVATRKEKRRLPDRKSRKLTFAPDSKTLASAGSREIRLWDVASGQRLHYRPGHDEHVMTVAVTPDGNVMASAAWDGHTMQLWDAATGNPLRLFKGHESDIRCCDFSSDGQWVISGGTSDGLRCWDRDSGKVLRSYVMEAQDPRLRNQSDCITFRLSPDKKRLAAIGLDDGAKQDQYHMNVWDVATGKQILRRQFRGGFDSRFSSDGRYVTVEIRQSLIIEEVTTGRELVTIPGDLGNPVAFSPDSKLLATGVHKTEPGPEGGYQVLAISLVEVATAKEIFRIDSEPLMTYLAFSPDGQVLAGADAKAIFVWDTATGKQLLRKPWPEGILSPAGWPPFHFLAFMANGRAVATGMRDGTILVWELAPQTWPSIGLCRDLGHEKLEGLWADLASHDARKAHLAIHALAAAPAQSVGFLKDRLRPAVELDQKVIERLIADLDSDRFPVREAAAKELAGLGEQVEPNFRQVLAKKPSAEVRKRLEALLAAPRPIPTGETLRTLRAIQALEYIGTSEAQQVLRTLAKGAPEARLTQEAKAALERLARKSVSTP